MNKKVAKIFGIAGFAFILLAVAHLFIAKYHLEEGQTAQCNQTPLFAAILTGAALICNYIFLLFTQSKISVLSLLAAHIAGLAVLYYWHSLMYFSVPYIMLPLMALMVRGIWGEKLTYTGGLWIELVIFLSAIPFYAAEIELNHQLASGAVFFPLLYFLTSGFMITDMLIDGIKMKQKVRRGAGLAAGETAPVFCLQNENNENICLSDYKGAHHVLLIFVRGEWCPLCHIMLRAYMKESALFREKNVFLLVVGPDPTGVNKKMAQDLKLDFHILSDPGLKVIQAYRLKIQARHLLHAGKYNEEREIPLPASFLIDKNGFIRFCSNPYKIGEVVKLPDIFPVLHALDASSTAEGAINPPKK